MGDFLRLLIDAAQFLWPLRLVEQWEVGVCYVFGRYWRTVGPGAYFVIPWFMEVRSVGIVPAIYTTPLQNVTLRDGRALSFSATITVQVEDAAKALNDVDQWPETTVELLCGMLSERMADVEPTRLDPARGKRDRLLEELRTDADDQTQVFGVRVKAIRFSNFTVGIRTYRLVMDKATLMSN